MPEYRMFIDNLGKTNFFRRCPALSATLQQSLTQASNSIVLDDVLPLFENDPNNIDEYLDDFRTPGVIWINQERIEYFGVDVANNVLIQLRRGTGGTAAVSHQAGSTVWDGTNRQTLIDTLIRTQIKEGDGVQTQFVFDEIRPNQNYTVTVNGSVPSFVQDQTDPLTLTFAVAPPDPSEIIVQELPGWVNQDVNQFPWPQPILDFLDC